MAALRTTSERGTTRGAPAGRPSELGGIQKLAVAEEPCSLASPCRAESFPRSDSRGAALKQDILAGLRRSGTSSGTGVIVLLFALLWALRLPILWTGHVQEDAFITFRCATQLADTGVYGFNPGERVSAATSHLYVAMVVLVRLLTGESFVLTVLALNGGLMVGALLLLSRALLVDRREWIVLWIMLSALPIALESSATGMETPLVMVAIALLVRGDSLNRPVQATVLGLLTWIRPEAPAYAVLLAIARERGSGWPRRLAREVAWISAGVAALLVFNTWYFGFPIHQTIWAKWISRSGEGGSFDTLTRILEIFLGSGVGGFLNPLPSRYTRWLGPFVVVAIVVGWLRARRCADAMIARRQGGLILAAVLPPCAYAFAGVVFPWYLWPSALLAFSVALIPVARKLSSASRPARLLPALLMSVGFVLYLGRISLSTNWGSQEAGYRAEIGRRVAARAEPGDTMMLEPAGYIPFFSGLYTYDEVGLVSRKVTDYRIQYGSGWWISFLRDVRPVFLVERPHLRDSVTFEGTRLSPSEVEWFRAHYELVETFRYSDYLRSAPTWLLPLLRRGSAVDYDLYRLRR